MNGWCCEVAKPGHHRGAIGHREARASIGVESRLAGSFGAARQRCVRLVP
jgi:hypothetical protein